MARRLPWFDRALSLVAPATAARRVQARSAFDILARHYEAAAPGRRTQHWARSGSDANAAMGVGGGFVAIRGIARDLVRNNGWARNAKRTITRNVVGWGIGAKATGPGAAKADALWAKWSGSPECDADGRLPFAGLQKMVMDGVFESGEMLIRRRWRRPEDGLSVPLQLQVLEPDFLDHTKHLAKGPSGGPIIYGVEFDLLGKRAAYWMFRSHPGGNVGTPATASYRVPAEEVLHVYDVERAGQQRGVSWLAAATLALKDFDEFEDAQLMRQKIAAVFAAFVTDVDGSGGAIGEASASDPLVETLEPGMIQHLPPGRDIKFGQPPGVTEDGFSARTLRKIAAAIGVSYEDLTGDYSQVNFSSARMARLSHWGNVYGWQWNMLIPQACDPVWRWFVEAANMGSVLEGTPGVEWSPQPMPIIEPDREARANMLAVRALQKTPSQVIRENGLDPKRFYAEYKADLAAMDAAGIWSDADVRRVSQAGLSQARPAGTGFNDEAAPAESPGSGTDPAPTEPVP